MTDTSSARPLKIAFVIPDDLSTLIFFTQFADALGESRDVEMTTISSVGEFETELRALSRRHIAVPMDRFVSPGRDLRYIATLYRIFRRERFDVVITFTTKPNTFGMTAARLARVPFRVMAVRGLGRVFERAASMPARALNRMVRALYASSAKASNLVWFTNEVDRAQFVDKGIIPAERSLLTRNAVNLRTYSMDRIPAERMAALRSELALPPDHLMVVMVARLIWSKGVREFADAAAAIRRTHPKVRFVLVAPPESGSQGAIPETWVREREAAGDIQWLGFRKDVLDLYALSDLAVLPSYYNEGGYPRTLLEPMALGKPVVGADTPVCRGPIVDGVTGLLVPPRDTDALAAAMLRLIDDAALRRRMGEASLERIRREFDDRQVAREVLERIRRGLDPQHSARLVS